MLKVLLVDDEIIVRLGIKSVIEWENHGFQYVGDAADGREALVLIEREQPDIVLTDILMPNMDGLELIKEIKRIRPHIRIIVLSSHDKYDYVRTAMKLGADDYILKASLQPEKLLRLLSEAAMHIAANQRREYIRSAQDAAITEEMQFFRNLREFIAGEADSLSAGVVNQLINIIRASNYTMLVRLHSYSIQSAEESTLLHLIEMHLRKWTNGRVISKKEREWMLLLPFDNPMNGEELEEIGQDLISAVKRVIGADISIGVSGVFHDPLEIKNAYDQSRKALQSYFFCGIGFTYLYMNHMPRHEQGTLLFSPEDEKLLKQELERIDEEAARTVVMTVLQRMKAANAPIELSIQTCLQMLHCFLSAAAYYGDEVLLELEKEEPLYQTIVNFETWNEANDWFEQFMEQLCLLLRKAIKAHRREDIQDLIYYIKDNYNSDLSLMKAARIVNLSEGYLSALFKKETGTGFIEYVNRLRIEKAEQLLRETELPSYVIGEQVGYENNNYFGRIFKKLTGLNPMEYRAIHKVRSVNPNR